MSYHSIHNVYLLGNVSSIFQQLIVLIRYPYIFRFLCVVPRNLATNCEGRRKGGWRGERTSATERYEPILLLILTFYAIFHASRDYSRQNLEIWATFLPSYEFNTFNAIKFARTPRLCLGGSKKLSRGAEAIRQ